MRPFTQLNLLTGEVNAPATIYFAAADLPTAAIGAQDKHLSMNYILVGDSEYTAAPTLTVFYTKGGADNSFSSIYNDVKLKRNRRTNIVGNIITSNLAGQNAAQNNTNNN